MKRLLDGMTAIGLDRARAWSAVRRVGLDCIPALRLAALRVVAEVRPEDIETADAATQLSHRPHFPSIEVHNTRTGFFEEQELQAVLAELRDHLRPLVQFLALTGWRVSEARALRWSQVDHAGGVVRLEVGTTKNGAGRLFPFAALPPLAALLRTQRERTSAVERETGTLCPWVFHRRGKPIQSFHHAWVAACRRAGVPGRLVHDLRRSAARAFVRSGVPERTAMALLGPQDALDLRSLQHRQRVGSRGWRP